MILSLKAQQSLAGAISASATHQAKALALLLALGAGCGSDAGGAGEASAPELDGTGPLYALGIRVSAADSTNGYLLTVPSIEPGTTWSLDRAVEVGQDAWLSGTEGELDVLQASSRDPTIQRWHVQADGSFMPGDFLTFANLGLNRSREARGSTSLYLRDKAYFLSSDGQIVVWSPRDMAIVGTIPFDVPEGLSPEGIFSGGEDRVLVALNFFRNDSPDPTVYLDNVHLLEIDPRTDQIVRETDEPRCNNLSSMSRAPSGATYHSPRAPITSYRVTLGEGHGPIDCALRIVPPNADFDAGFDVGLTTLVGGRPAGGLTMVTDDIAFIRVWHEELAPPLAPDRSNFEDLMFAAAYQWWRWEVGSAAAELLPDQLPTTGQWDSFDVEGKKLLPVVAPDFSSTQLVELQPDGGMRSLISGPGTLLGIVRVR